MNLGGLIMSSEKNKKFSAKEVVITATITTVIGLFLGYIWHLFLPLNNSNELTFSFYMNNEEVIVTEGDVLELYEGNEQLRSQNISLELANENLENERDDLQIQVADLEEQIEGFENIETDSLIDINIVYNEMQLDDSMQALVVEDETFLSVIAMEEILSYSFDWDESNSRVYIDSGISSMPNQPETSTPDGGRFLQIVPWFESSRMASETVYMQGNRFLEAMINAHQDILGWSHHNLNGQFSSITGIVGRRDGSETGSRMIRFIGDGQELSTFSVDGSTPPTEISVDVTGVLILRIEIEYPWDDGARIAFADARIQ